MNARIAIRKAAQNDLDALTDYYLAEAGSETASRFVEQARASFLALTRNPGLGPTVGAKSSSLTGLRKWRIDGFPKVLIFYQPIGGGVRIVRVVHSAADWWSLIGIN